MLELSWVSKNYVNRRHKNAFLCIELVDENREKEFENALKELSQLVEKNLGGKSKVSILHINNKEAII